MTSDQILRSVFPALGDGIRKRLEAAAIKQGSGIALIEATDCDK